MSEAIPVLYGTAVALGARAVLLRGPSGSGKSDLALRCLNASGPLIPEPVRLVADDQVQVAQDGGRIYVSPPAAIAGLIEVRGVGIVEVPPLPRAELALIADLVADPKDVERMPHAHFASVNEVRIPLLSLYPFEASAPLKLLLALGGAGYPGNGEE